MTPTPTRADLERLIAQLEKWDADGESGRLLLEAAVMLRALSPSVALEPPPERCRHKKTGGTYTVLHSDAVMEHDHSSVIVYQSETNGQIYVRPCGEFAEKFERIFVTAPAIAPPLEPGTWQCRKCGYNRTVGPTWACPTIGICEPAIAPDALTEAQKIIDALMTRKIYTELDERAAAMICTLRDQLAAMRAATGPEDADIRAQVATLRRTASTVTADDNMMKLAAATRIESLAAQLAAARKLPLSYTVIVARAEKAERENAAMRETMRHAEEDTTQVAVDLRAALASAATKGER